MKNMGKVKLPKGFSLSAVNCGIKKKKLDLGLIYCEDLTQAAGFFTTNANVSYSVTLSKKNITNPVKAVLVNSGNANCFSHKSGLKDTEEICSHLANHLGVNEKNILIASTGIIGKILPKDKIINSLEYLTANLGSDIDNFAESILTTDTFKKISFKDISLKNTSASIVGFAKGAGMIYPNLVYPGRQKGVPGGRRESRAAEGSPERPKEVQSGVEGRSRWTESRDRVKGQSRGATMLSFIITDVNVEKAQFREIAKSAVEKSFNSITIDGCMSTNDTVIFLSSNKALLPKNKIKLFSEKLEELSLDLAKMITKDAEGATKFIEIEIKGAKSIQEAKTAGLAVANSNLFKCAVYGANPNWGRVISALGQAGIGVKENISIKSTALKEKNIKITIDLKRGIACWKTYTSDLTEEYVKINAEYS